MVTALKSAQVQPSRAARVRERCALRTKPNAAQPRTLGTKNAQNPGQPQSRSIMKGRYMPMHQVQLDVQNRPHWMLSRVRLTPTV